MARRRGVDDQANQSRVDDPVSRRVGERIRTARQEQGLSLAALGGTELTRGFLSAVETGRSSISLKSLDVVATRLRLPLSYFVDDRPMLHSVQSPPTVDHVDAALAYGRYLRARGKTAEALEYALWAAETTVQSLHAENQRMAATPAQNGDDSSDT
jgi:transcriptional regulator with XRE-family HTH domain